MAEGKSSRRIMGAFVVLALLPLLLVMVLGIGLYDALHPDAAPDELRTRTPRRLTTRAVPVPLDVQEGCDVTVRVVLGGDEPVADATVTVRPRAAPDGTWSVEEQTDSAGLALFEGLPCGSVTVAGTHETYASGPSQTLELEDGMHVEHTLRMAPSFEVVGTIRDDGGAPIAGATVRIDFDGKIFTQTDELGQYRQQLRLLETNRSILTIQADAFGYAVGSVRQELLPEDGAAHAGVEDAEAELARAVTTRDVLWIAAGTQVELNLTLWPQREVLVWCAGLPNDHCNQMLVQCTHPLVPLGGDCEQDPKTGETVCNCDQQTGAVAIRGGGKSTLLELGETEAWLDFRDAGVLTGRVVVDGEPVADCDVVTGRIPNGLEDLPRGFIAAHKERCDAEGRFALKGLVDGDWEVVVESEVDGLGEVQRVLDPVAVRARGTTNVGDIELFSGGGIEGSVTDGVTGEVRNDAPIMALKRSEGAGRSTPYFADIDRDGSFAFQGLTPGDWELCYFLTPHVRTHVTVEEGVITDGVEVETSDATALETNGFSLGMEEGELRVQDVEADSPADLAGLLPGDRVDAVLLAGLDVAGHLGSQADTFMQLVLGHWDGPGVTLVVDRDGEALEVELDW